MQHVTAFSRPQTVPPVPTIVPKRNVWILDSWRDLILYVGTPLLIIPLFTLAPAGLSKREKRNDQQRRPNVKNQVAPTVEDPDIALRHCGRDRRNCLRTRKCGDVRMEDVDLPILSDIARD